jgi:hypothetical protein
MNYSINIFGKELTDLTYTDIENYFQEEKEESNIIEYKSYSAKYGNFNVNIEGVIKGICAFLNSDGGILIWGSPEGKKVDSKQEKVFIGDLSPIPYLKGKDYFINKISDSITPLPIGINVQPIKNKGVYLYIFEIQKSNYSPHQYRDKYFARLDGQTKPAPHYLIEALFKKISFPHLEGFIKLIKISQNKGQYYLDIEIYIFNFSHFQNEENVAFRLMCPQGIFAKSQEYLNPKMYNNKGHQLVHKDLIDVLYFGAPICHSEKLIFNPNELLNKHHNKAVFLLTFGGKSSPLKSSVYELDFSRIDWDKPDNPNYLLKEINENRFFADIQKEKNMTRESTLKAILER